MFSRRKLFQMAGIGTAVAATAQLVPSGSAETPLLSAANLNMTDLIRAQREINVRRTEMIRISDFKREYLREFAASPADKPYQRIMDSLA